MGISLNGSALYATAGYRAAGDATAYHQAYNLSTNVWSILTPLPTARAGVVAAFVNGRFYVIGGTLSFSGGGLAVAVNEAFNPATSAWSTVAPMPTARDDAGVAVVNNQIYVIGGEDYGIAQRTVEIFTP